MELNDRELATVLASLRLFQTTDAGNAAKNLGLEPYFEEALPLNAEEIDKLCERLNTEDSALELRSDNEYSLKTSHNACWVEVNNVSVHIERGVGDCAIALYQVGDETREPLGYTSVVYPESNQ